MEYVNISGTKLNSSRIGLGTWSIGGWLWGGSDENESIRTIHKALDSGINLIDTAPVYGLGISEEIVCKAIKNINNRESFIIATKVGLEWNDRGVFRNSTGKRILKEIDDSLLRLGVDYIDIYQIHWPDPLTPIDETADVISALIDKGKILAAGVSNYNSEQMKKFESVLSLNTAQPPYNLFERDIEVDVYPYCQENNITMLFYGALCRGLLSGRMRHDTTFQRDDIRNIDPKFKKPRYIQYLDAVDVLQRYAEENYGKSVLELSVRWILDKSPKDIALWGARKPSQLDNLINIFGWSLSNEDFTEIDRILMEHIRDPVGPEFMSPGPRDS